MQTVFVHTLNATDHQASIDVQNVTSLVFELIKNLHSKDIPVIVMTGQTILSDDVRDQLKGQHVYDKLDLLYRMDEIIGKQLNLNLSIGSEKKAS